MFKQQIVVFIICEDKRYFKCRSIHKLYTYIHVLSYAIHGSEHTLNKYWLLIRELPFNLKGGFLKKYSDSQCC